MGGLAPKVGRDERQLRRYKRELVDAGYVTHEKTTNLWTWTVTDDAVVVPSSGTTLGALLDSLESLGF
jgi:hypothetical protein